MATYHESGACSAQALSIFRITGSFLILRAEVLPVYFDLQLGVCRNNLSYNVPSTQVEGCSGD